MKEEIWKDVPGYEGHYRASNKGRLFSIKSNRLLKLVKINSGYLIAAMSKDGVVNRVLAHRLFASIFVPNPLNKPQVNHKDGVKSNPDTDNLEWVTASENGLHSYRIGTSKSGLKGMTGRRCAFSIPVLQFTKDGTFISEYDGVRDASRATGIGNGQISSVANKKYGFVTAGGFIWRYK